MSLIIDEEKVEVNETEEQTPVVDEFLESEKKAGIPQEEVGAVDENELGIGADDVYVPRLTCPQPDNKYYVKQGYGNGINPCILGYPLYAPGSVLSNCVGYAYGAYMEHQGLTSCRLSRANAENWYGHNDGYKRGMTPRLGAVMCWSKGRAGDASDGAGHVAIVEKIEGDKITISQSNYGGTTFVLSTYTHPYYSHGQYYFQGFIYPDKVWDNPTPTPVPSYKPEKGLDISEWQDGLDLADVKEAGYKFVILRAGYTGYGTGKSYSKDKCFENFYKQAKKLGLKVGAYWYSCASSADLGKAEAEYMYNNCLKGKQFDMPIYIDVEDDHWQAKTVKGTTDAIIAFGDFLEAKKYFVGVYANYNWFKNRIEENRIKRFSHWLAYWTNNKPSVDFPYALWQYTSSNYVGKYRVDTNWAYEDFAKIIKDNKLNGYDSTPAPEPTPTPAKKTIEELAREVIAGKWGNGQYRIKKLKDAGYDYDKVQARVNEILKNQSKKSNEEIAREVIAGKWGNGQTRKTKLTAAGYDYDKVQALVNKMLAK